jgi:hypothetical protein
MNVRFRLGVLLVALVAVLGAASPAMAKGGTGGGGGGGGGATAPGCAVIQSWTNTLTTSATGQPFVTMTFGVDNQCVDEFGASRAMVELDTYDTATGKWLTGFGQGLNLGLHYFTYGEPYVPADAAPAHTITFSAFRINGQVQDSRTVTYAQLMRMVQPAA